MAACILHNFLLSPSDNQRLLDEEQQLGRRMTTVMNMGGNGASQEGFFNCGVEESVMARRDAFQWTERLEIFVNSFFLNEAYE